MNLSRLNYQHLLHYEQYNYMRQLLDILRHVKVAVGMAITGHPPHRSGRALLTHPAPISGIWRRTAVQDKDELSVGLAAIS